MMKYLISVVVVLIFSLIYLAMFKLNKKLEVKCDKKTCHGCNFLGCIHRSEEE